MARKRPVHHYSRGLLHRLAGATIGFVFSAVLVAGLSLSETLPNAAIVLRSFGFVTPTSAGFPQMPSNISYGVEVPALHLGYFPTEKPVPIASVTKMMTAYVALQSLGNESQDAKCYVVDSQDVAAYHHEVATGQSTALVVLGESICFPDLMRGLMIHSASDYALIFSRMFASSESDFVAKMNREAKTLGMGNTTYADPTGVNPENTSTPQDQLRLAAKLMKYQLVRDAVRLPAVTLPVAGTLNSFTPFAGQNNVIGLKSGRTDAAGGCDVMATQIVYQGKTLLGLVAVFGARGGDLLKPAGDAALTLSNAISSRINTLTLPTGKKVGKLQWEGRSVAIIVEHSSVIYSWTFHKSSALRVVMKRVNSPLASHSIIGHVYGPSGELVATLVTDSVLVGPSLWQRIL